MSVQLQPLPHALRHNTFYQSYWLVQLIGRYASKHGLRCGEDDVLLDRVKHAQAALRGLEANGPFGATNPKVRHRHVRL